MKFLQKILQKHNIDIALFANFSIGYNENLKYLSGFTGLGVLVVPKKAKPFIVAPPLDKEKASKTKLKQYDWPKGTKVYTLIADILKKNKINYKTIGLDFNAATVRMQDDMSEVLGKGKKFKDVSGHLREYRAIKSKEEIKILTTACRYTDEIMKTTIQNIREFQTESDIAAFMQYQATILGCDLSFPTIVASGKNASMPHYTPKPTKLKKGFLVIDFGIKYKGYCSDITRTIYLGAPSIEEIKAYEQVLLTQKQCIKMCKVGAKAADIYNVAKDALGDAFCHGLGHGIGIEIHELPNLKPASTEKLKAGMVLTVEPGVYYPNKFGIRIEDDVLVTSKGPKVLTKTGKHLLIIR